MFQGSLLGNGKNLALHTNVGSDLGLIPSSFFKMSSSIGIKCCNCWKDIGPEMLGWFAPIHDILDATDIFSCSLSFFKPSIVA